MKKFGDSEHLGGLASELVKGNWISNFESPAAKVYGKKEVDRYGREISTYMKCKGIPTSYRRVREKINREIICKRMKSQNYAPIRTSFPNMERCRKKLKVKWTVKTRTLNYIFKKRYKLKDNFTLPFGYYKHRPSLVVAPLNDSFTSPTSSTHVRATTTAFVKNRRRRRR